MRHVVTGFGSLPARPFVPGAEPLRVSLVWWLDGPTAGADPCFVSLEDGTAATVVAVWPCDAHGAPIRERIADVRVCEWRLSPPRLKQLEAQHRSWPLGLYDLLVRVRDGELDLAPREVNLWGLALVTPTDEAQRVVALISAEVTSIAGILRKAA